MLQGRSQLARGDGLFFLLNVDYVTDEHSAKDFWGYMSFCYFFSGEIDWAPQQPPIYAVHHNTNSAPNPNPNPK